MISRGLLARRLGITRQYLAQVLEKKRGLLTPIKIDRRVWYEDSQVAEMMAVWKRRKGGSAEVEYTLNEHTERGRIAAQTFVILDEGGTFHDCVILTQGDPVWVREFYDAYTISPEEARAVEAVQAHTEALAKATNSRMQLEVKYERAQIRKLIADADRARAQRGEPPMASLSERTVEHITGRMTDVERAAEQAKIDLDRIEKERAMNDPLTKHLLRPEGPGKLTLKDPPKGKGVAA